MKVTKSSTITQQLLVGDWDELIINLPSSPQQLIRKGADFIVTDDHLVVRVEATMPTSRAPGEEAAPSYAEIWIPLFQGYFEFHKARHIATLPKEQIRRPSGIILP